MTSQESRRAAEPTKSGNLPSKDAESIKSEIPVDHGELLRSKRKRLQFCRNRWFPGGRFEPKHAHEKTAKDNLNAAHDQRHRRDKAPHILVVRQRAIAGAFPNQNTVSQ